MGELFKPAFNGTSPAEARVRRGPRSGTGASGRGSSREEGEETSLSAARSEVEGVSSAERGESGPPMNSSEMSLGDKERGDADISMAAFSKGGMGLLVGHKTLRRGASRGGVTGG